jgi:hypothetical protein
MLLFGKNIRAMYPGEYSGSGGIYLTKLKPRPVPPAKPVPLYGMRKE